MSQVVLRDVTKSFGATTAVDRVTLTVADGEFVVLVGPSGCGKSTLLRMVAGLEDVSSGAIEIDGVVVNDLPPKDRDVAMVFQNYALYPHYTVADNLGFSLRIQHVPKQRRQEQVRETARVLGLEPLLDRKPAALSGGQRQRVAMGRALVRQPQLFLMDEPLSNLDAKLRVAMRAELMRLHQQYRTTTIYVTHDQVEAMTLGDRIAVLDRGRLQQIGTPEELYHHPCNVFVAGFIGSPAMNLARGRLMEEPAGLVLKSGEFAWQLPPRIAEGLTLYAGREILFGLRPEALRLAPAGSDFAALPVTAVTVESLGDEKNVLFVPPLDLTTIGTEAEDEPAMLWTARCAPDANVQAGQAIVLGLDLDAAYFFDARSGEAIALAVTAAV